MVKAIRDQRSFLTMLRFAGAKPKNRKQMLVNTRHQQVRAISQIAVNVLYGILKLTKKQRKILRSIKPLLRLLGNRKISLKQKKAALIKHHPKVYTLIVAAFNGIKRLIWQQ